MFSGSLCSGFIIVRREDGEWGAPSSIGSAGVGWGLQIGGQLNEAVIGLYSQAAIEAFSGHGQLQLGGEAGVSLGPVGRTAALSFRLGVGGERTASLSGTYCFSRSRGLYGGLAVDGAVLLARPEDNFDIYGEHLSVAEILYEAARPAAADELYASLTSLEVKYRQQGQHSDSSTADTWSDPLADLTRSPSLLPLLGLLVQLPLSLIPLAMRADGENTPLAIKKPTLVEQRSASFRAPTRQALAQHDAAMRGSTSSIMQEAKLSANGWKLC